MQKALQESEDKIRKLQGELIAAQELNKKLEQEIVGLKQQLTT